MSEGRKDFKVPYSHAITFEILFLSLSFCLIHYFECWSREISHKIKFYLLQTAGRDVRMQNTFTFEGVACSKWNNQIEILILFWKYCLALTSFCWEKKKQQPIHVDDLSFIVNIKFIHVFQFRPITFSVTEEKTKL